MRALKKGLALLRIPDLRFARETCPLCQFPIILQLQAIDIGVRCLRCGASAITQSLVDALESTVPDLACIDAYELSAQGPFVKYLKTRTRSLTTSEFFEDVPRGASRNGVRCEDVEALTFPDSSFDVCTSTEVFEHVADDRRGFRETLRVLRPGGYVIFTVPLSGERTTVERTSFVDGRRVETMPAEYHADRFRGPRVFCYRNYGDDITDRLEEAGFVDTQLFVSSRRLFDRARRVVIARRPR